MAASLSNIWVFDFAVAKVREMMEGFMIIAFWIQIVPKNVNKMTACLLYKMKYAGAMQQRSSLGIWLRLKHSRICVFNSNSFKAFSIAVKI